MRKMKALVMLGISSTMTMGTMMGTVIPTFADSITINSLDDVALKSAQSGDTITLTGSATISNSLTIRPGVTLDLGGNTVYIARGNGYATLNLGDKATIKNGKIEAANRTLAVNVDGTSANATISKVTLNSTTLESALMFRSNGSLDMSNCTIKAENADAGINVQGGPLATLSISSSSITANGIGLNVDAGGSVDLDSTTINANKTNGIGIMTIGGSPLTTLNIDGSTIKAASGIIAQDAIILLSKTNVTAWDEWDNQAVVLNYANTTSDGYIRIISGKYVGRVGYTDGSGMWQYANGPVTDREIVLISGGTFKQDRANASEANRNVIGYIASGCYLNTKTGVVSGDPTYPDYWWPDYYPWYPPYDWNNQGYLNTTVKPYTYVDADGQRVRNAWRQHNGVWYYFDNNGRAVSGLQTIDNSKYYFSASTYQMLTGWQYISNANYYFGSDGKMLTGLQTINGKVYYLNEDGKMQSGVVKTNTGKIYEFASNGARVDNKGWKDVSGKTYYFLDDHSALVGTRTLDGKTYTFGENGALVSQESAKPDVSDKNGLIYANGKTQYWINGIMQTGWQKLPASTSNPGWHYFNEADGALVYGWNKLYDSGKVSWYYFDSNGEMKTGWQRINGNFYYLKSSGAMEEGWLKLNGSWYYLNPGDGAMTTGWKKLPWEGDYRWFYFYETGVMATGIVNVGGEYYYLYNDGTMAGARSGGTVTIGSLRIDSAGKILNPEALFGFSN